MVPRVREVGTYQRPAGDVAMIYPEPPRGRGKKDEARKGAETALLRIRVTCANCRQVLCCCCRVLCVQQARLLLIANSGGRNAMPSPDRPSSRYAPPLPVLPCSAVQTERGQIVVIPKVHSPPNWPPPSCDAAAWPCFSAGAASPGLVRRRHYSSQPGRPALPRRPPFSARPAETCYRGNAAS